MAKFEAKKEVSEMAVNECYQMCLEGIESAGYKIFKTRELANLIICNETIDGQKVSLSLMVPFGSPTTINLNLSSDEMDENALQSEAERILDVNLCEPELIKSYQITLNPQIWDKIFYSTAFSLIISFTLAITSAANSFSPMPVSNAIAL